MRAFAIVLKDVPTSLVGYNKLLESHRAVGNNIELEQFDAITADEADKAFSTLNVKWTWPWEGTRHDLNSGLVLSAYKTATPSKRVACFMSHYTLWQKCIELDEPIVILEHDAEFIKKLDVDMLINSKYDIIGINYPIGATRRAREFLSIVESNNLPVQTIPRIDHMEIPQGLAGNSAYFMKPSGAAKAIQAVKNFGGWPNDALMCYQNIGTMGVTKTFYTKVQGLPSTTTQ